MSYTAPSTAGSDFNLLFGILAVQMDFISRDALIEAMNAWVLDKGRSLGRILVDRGALAEDTQALLNSLVAKHLQMHGNDPEKSLQSLSSVSSLRDELHKIADSDLEASLANISGARKDDDAYVTRPVAAGNQTSAGQRFRILRPHAKGGLGEVFVAEDEELHREVALKEIQGLHADDPNARARFLLEAEITGGLEHPGIVPVYGLGQYADGRPFYAMRFIRGDNLKDAIERFHRAEGLHRDTGERTLEFRKLLRRFQDVCNAVAYAHSRGVLHRDLKPGNIMLGQFGETLVVDWGLAKAKNEEDPYLTRLESPIRPSWGSGPDPTKMGSTIGTPQFMSPEQAAGRLDLLSPASDVYSLGATLYCLLTGKSPFPKGEVAEVLNRVQKGDFPAPREVAPHVPVPLNAICLKAMSLKPEERYALPSALAEEIEHWLADEPVTAWREPALVRTGRWIRKHRTLVSSAAAMLFVAITSLVIATLILTKLNHKLDHTNRDLQASLDRETSERQRAEANEIKANEKENETRTVLDFVENKVFAAARPANEPGGLGYDVTLRRAIETALPFVESGFSEQPLIEARLRMTIGLSFWHLGDAKKAATQFQTARKIYTTLHGPDHPDTLRSMRKLANSFDLLGQYGDALKLHEETLAIQKEKFGPDHADTLASMNSLALTYSALGRHSEAQKLHEETLAIEKAKLGVQHPDTLRTMANLAQCRLILGDYGEALKLHRETLDLRKAHFKPNDADTLRSMMHVANCLAILGHHADAVKLHEETLALQKANLGPDHPDTLLTMNSLANSYYGLGRYPNAVKLHEQTLALQKAKIGPDHPDTLQTQLDLADSYYALNRYADALKLHEETLALRKTKLGPRHPDTLNSMNSSAVCYYALGRKAEAQKLYTETLSLQKSALGPDHPATLRTLHNLAVNYQSLGRHAEALKLFEETLAHRKTKLGPDHPDTLATMHNLAICYAALDRHTDALNLRQEMLELRKTRLGPNHPETLLSMWSVAASLVHLGQGKDAVPLIDQCLQRAVDQDVHPSLVSGLLTLRLRHFEKTNDAAGCRATAEMWEWRMRTDIEGYYNAACFRAVTAAVVRGLSDRSPDAAKQADLEANQAMAWLHKAVSAGFKDAAQMEKDADLGALRTREDFKKLMADLAAKK